MINFELPIEIQRYIHRIGRTARAGKEGVSLTLCDDSESKALKSMIKKTGDQVHKKSLKDPVVKKYLHLITSFEQDYINITMQEAAERSIRKAEMEA